MDSNLKKEIKRLKQLKQNREKSDNLLEKEAKKNIFLRNLTTSGNFEGIDEKRKAKMFFEKYMQNKEYESEADLSLLGMLVYNEVLIDRIQKTINLQKNKEGAFFINDKLLKSLHDTEKQVIDLKQELGLDEKVEAKKQDELTSFQEGKKKVLLHWAFNKHEYTTVCSKCGEILHLRRKTKDFECIKHPFFSGRFWYNARGIELVKKGIWTKAQYAHVFWTSVDYVDWVIANEGKIIEVDNYSKEEVENFILEKDYLKEGFLRTQQENFKNTNEVSTNG